MNFPKLRNPFKSQEEVDISDESKDNETDAQEDEEIDLGGIHFGEDISPESEAKTLNRKAILGGIGVVALLVVTAISSNFSKEAVEDKPLV